MASRADCGNEDARGEWMLMSKPKVVCWDRVARYSWLRVRDM